MTEPGQQPPGQPPEDRELEEFLAGRSPLSRVHREGAQEQAPPPLDARILQQARDELRRARPVRRVLRWDGPLALAASTVLVVGLAWLVRMQLPRPGAEQSVSAAPVSSAPVSPAPAPPAASGASAIQLQEATPSALKKQEEAPAGPPLKQPPAVAAKPQSVPQPFPAPPRRAADESMDLARAKQPQQAAGAISRFETRKEGPQNQAMQATQAPAPPSPVASYPNTAGATGAPPSAAPSAAQSFPASPGMALVQKSAANQPAADAAAPDPCAASQRSAAQRQAQPEQHLQADAWLDQIRALRDAPDAEAARAELACFVARHPLAEVPADLKPLQ
ncbi:MAG: hypothetical protein JOY51_03185 [Nevskia sp.]|nr:hypothetical protein [Nevskia sp.]